MPDLDKVHKLLTDITVFAATRNTWGLSQVEKDNCTDGIINRVEQITKLLEE